MQPYPGGLHRLLTDEESQRVASAMGVLVEAKLSAAQMRHVILNTRSTGKDAEAIRRLARDYSFSDRPLSNLDKIMESVIREKVNFNDLVSVVVSIIQERLGGERDKKVELKNMRDQMEAWILNRQAAEHAVQSQPKVNALRQLIDDHRKQSNVLRSLRLDLDVLGSIKAQEKITHAEQLEELVATHERESAEQNEIIAGIDADLEDARSDVAQSSRDLNYLQSQSDHFSQNNAPLWSDRVKKLPQLEELLNQRTRSLSLAKSKASDAARELQEEIGRFREKTHQELERLESSKSPVHAQAHQELQNAELAAKEETQILESRQAEDIAMVDERVNDLRSDLANAKAKIDLHADKPEDVDRLTRAEELLKVVNASLDAALADERTARNAVHEAKMDFASAGHAHEKAKTVVAVAQQAMDRLIQSRQPQPGTLMASLLGSKDASWRSDLARIINPDLLRVSGLSAQAPKDDDATDTIFGWRIPLDAIEVPAWANVELLNAESAQHSERLAHSEEVCSKALAVFEEASKALKKAERALTESEAALSVAKPKRAQQIQAVEEAKRALDKAREKTKEEARAQAAQIDAQLKSALREHGELKAAQRTKMRELEAAQAAKRNDIQNILQGTIHGIERNKERFRKDRETILEEMQRESVRRLKDAGVDTEYVSRLESELVDLNIEIKDLTDKKSIAREWATWIEKGGEQQISQASVKHEDLRLRQASLESLRFHHKKSMDAALAQFKSASHALRHALQVLDSEISRVGLLQQRMSEHQPLPSMTSVVTKDTDVSQLEGQVNNALNSHEQNHRDVQQKHRSLENVLVVGKSAVAGLIDGYVIQECSGLDVGPVEKARFFCEAFDRIPQQVIAPLHTELSTILETLMSFKARIDKFESGARAFNKELQAGIRSVVSTFTRLSDFKIDVVTTFEDVGFLVELDGLTGIVRELRANSTLMTSNVEVPKADVVGKLRDVISAIGDGHYELELGKYVTLKGSAVDEGVFKSFHNEKSLENLSSTGITAIAMVTLLTGMLNVVRGTDDIWLPWSTDEVGRFDANNFGLLMEMLSKNKIDVLTASPSLTAGAYGYFQHRYLFQPGNQWSVYAGSAQDLENANQRYQRDKKTDDDEPQVVEA
jgi:hypothetical protein